MKIQATFRLILLGDFTKFSNGWVNETRHERSFIMEQVLYVVVCLRLIDTFNLNEIFTANFLQNSWGNSSESQQARKANRTWNVDHREHE